MSAPLVAKRDRNASGIWSRKSVIDGWPRRLGQIAAYIRTISTIEASQPRRPRRCSCKVLRKTLRNMCVLLGVVGEEGLLQLGLGTLEVHDGVPADLLDEGVERALRSTARQHVVLHGQVANAGESCEGCGVDRLGKRGSDVMERPLAQKVQPVDRYELACPEDPDPVRDALHLAEHVGAQEDRPAGRLVFMQDRVELLLRKR